jgi:hypothetical protein
MFWPASFRDVRVVPDDVHELIFTDGSPAAAYQHMGVSKAFGVRAPAGRDGAAGSRFETGTRRIRT